MQFVTVYNSLDTGNAMLVKSQLDAAGFTTLVPDEHSNFAIEGSTLAIGGLRIQVPEDQEQDARNFLSANFPDEPPQNP